MEPRLQVQKITAALMPLSFRPGFLDTIVSGYTDNVVKISQDYEFLQ